MEVRKGSEVSDDDASMVICEENAVARTEGSDVELTCGERVADSDSETQSDPEMTENNSKGPSVYYSSQTEVKPLTIYFALLVKIMFYMHTIDKFKQMTKKESDPEMTENNSKGPSVYYSSQTEVNKILSDFRLIY